VGALPPGTKQWTLQGPGREDKGKKDRGQGGKGYKRTGGREIVERGKLARERKKELQADQATSGSWK